jgi:hypothetical protein
MASGTTRVPKRADDLGALTLPDADEREHQLGDLWHDGPAVLVFLRHYG